MKTLKDLTPEIEEKIPEYKRLALDGVSDGARYREFEHAKAVKAVEWNYNYVKLPLPKKVFVAENPYEMILMYYYVESLLKSNKTLEDYTDSGFLAFVKGEAKNITMNNSMEYSLYTLSVYSDAYYYWYEFLRKEFELDLTINEDFQKCFELQRASKIYKGVFTDVCTFVSKYPTKVYWNDDAVLHNPKGPAVEWASKFPETAWNDCYYINGRSMPSNIFETPFSKEDFIKEPNEDVKAGMYEIIESRGEGSMLEFLGAKEVSTESFVHDDGSIEHMCLYKTTDEFEEEEDLNGKSPAQLAWLKMSCPSTGQVYLIPSDSSFNTCNEAARYHRPVEVPSSLKYTWSQRN